MKRAKKRDFLKIINLYSKCLNCNFFANLSKRDWLYEIPGKVCQMNLKLKFYVMLKGLHLGKHFVFWYLNTQYITNSTLVSPVKIEYGWNFSISGLKMMKKSGLGKISLKFFHALTMLFLLLNLYFWSKFSNKNDMVSAWRNFKNIFPRPLFIIIFRPETLKFHPYSILTGDTRVEFVIYCVLSMA